MIFRRVLLVIYLCTIVFAINAQLDLSFYNYLDEHHFKREQETYINVLSNTTSQDTLCYLKARFYFRYDNDSHFFENYTKCKTLFLSDTFVFTKATIHFLKSTNTIQQHLWFDNIDSSKISVSCKQLKQVYQASLSPLNFNINELPASLQNDFLKYKTNYKKKCFVAGGLSAILPGLGKLYTGRKKSFVITLITNGILAVQSYESVYRLGVLNPFSILSIGVFSVFYFANIYGSYYDVGQIKEETKTQFLINASDYFNTNYTSH